MYRWVKNAELAVIPGADHFSIALKAGLIVLMISHFMRQVIENLENVEKEINNEYQTDRSLPQSQRSGRL
jgi:hypothetical protein